jgi:hypothetical protein
MNPTRLTRSAWLLVGLACLALTACGAAGAVVDARPGSPTPFPTGTAAPTDAATGTPEPRRRHRGNDTLTDAPPAETPAPDSTSTRRPTATRPALTRLLPPTPRPTATPTSLPQVDPTAALNITGSMREGDTDAADGHPLPRARCSSCRTGTTNILLLGKDVNADGSGDGRTDTMIVVSVNRETGTASMISLPRDLYVYMPNRIMSRLNTGCVPRRRRIAGANHPLQLRHTHPLLRSG